MSGYFTWHDHTVPFRTGESVASALDRAGIRAFGPAGAGREWAVFCGIGQCQGCLVLHEGQLTEACLLPAREGMRLGDEGNTDA